MAWNDGFCFFMGHACGIDEMPDDPEEAEKRIYDEDAAYEEARDRRAFGEDDET